MTFPIKTFPKSLSIDFVGKKERGKTKYREKRPVSVKQAGSAKERQEA